VSEDESDVQYWIRRLSEGTPRERVNSLRSIAARPLADERLLRACESLLTDRAIAVLSIPYTFGEVRWCAADAVVALREVLAIDEPVILDDAFPPCTTTEIARLAAAAGIPASIGGIDGDLAALRALAASNVLPRTTIRRFPALPDRGDLPPQLE
jgi:hypothetical protein